jgi:hypothetical protein
MLKRIFLSPMAGAAANWLGIAVAAWGAFTFFISRTPEWFGPLRWPQIFLAAIGMTASLFFVLGVSGALCAWAYRQFRPLPHQAVLPVALLPPRPAPTVGTPKREAWIPLHIALRHLVYDSEWAHRQTVPGSQQDFDRIVQKEFKERLARGEVKARGSKGKNWEADRPTQDIPASYWLDGFVRPYGSLVLADENQDAAGNPVEQTTYRNVLVSHDELWAVWPKAAIQGLSPLATFCEPQRLAIEQEKGNKKPSFASFGYAYPKAVLKASIPQEKGERSARSGEEPHEMGIAFAVLNDHKRR